MSHIERTMVGIPFYEMEGQETLDVTLTNLDMCLGRLGVDASIIVQLNGPETQQGNPPHYEVSQSKYNADIEVVQGQRRGLVNAVDDIVHHAEAQMIDKVFITDTDVYRFPESIKAMWEVGDKPVVGARYRPYPVEVVEALYGPLTWQEKLLYEVFDGDQSPQVRQVLRRFDADRTDRVKGSLMLLDVETAKHMHEGQDVITDSVMNRSVSDHDKKIAEGAHFMHMGRVDMTDHVKARLRHFRGAAARNDVAGFIGNEVTAPDEETMDAIAAEIRSSEQKGDFYAMLYLSRCAVRAIVSDTCRGIVENTWEPSMLPAVEPLGMDKVKTYADAHAAVSRFFVDVNWEEVLGYSVKPPAPTQERFRAPLDLTPYLGHDRLGKAIFDTLGVEAPLAKDSATKA